MTPAWHPDHARRPDVLPSNVPYVTRARNPTAGIVSVVRPEFCTYEGFTLRGLIAQLWDVPESRITFMSPIEADALIDVVLVPPDPSRVDMETLLREGITTHFGLDVSLEERPTDVLVLSAPNGIVGMESPGGGGLGAWSESFEEVSLSPAGFKVSGIASVEVIRDMLEHLQDRLVVDQTGASGSFEIDIDVDSGVDNLIAALRDQLGIVTTRSRCDVRMLTVRRRKPDSDHRRS